MVRRLKFPSSRPQHASPVLVRSVQYTTYPYCWGVEFRESTVALSLVGCRLSCCLRCEYDIIKSTPSVVGSQIPKHSKLKAKGNLLLV
jgi:hypothetical protein